MGQIGGKAEGLELLLKHTDIGYRVPKFSAIYASFYDLILKQLLVARLLSVITRTPHKPNRLPEGFQDAISLLLREFGGRPVIVRSSSVNEDTQHSFAGIYKSSVIQNLTESELNKAILLVYCSVNSDRAKQYRAEHGIKEDRMAIIVQQFIEPDWSGVMYTSNPTYPDDLFIEFVKGRNRVVEGAEDAIIVDYDKKRKERVFKSENSEQDNVFDVDRLARIGIALEQRIGASDIEFSVKDGIIYLIQARRITDLQYPQEVKIPRYKKAQFLGSTRVKRGTGKVTLPVVKVMDILDLAEKIGILMIISKPEMTEDQMRRYFSGIIAKDRQYERGYVLLLPHFHATIMPAYSIWAPDIQGGPTFDNLTPHKKAVITTRAGSVSSHIMTIARERGIVYAGFDEADDMFREVQTEDIVSIYFVGREARVYLEESPPKNIRETHPSISFTIETKEGRIFVTTSEFIDSTKPYLRDFERFLLEATGERWTFKPFGGIMGGSFKNREGQSILMMMAHLYGQCHQWYFATQEYCKIMRYKPLPEAELEKILQKYEAHLTE